MNTDLIKKQFRTPLGYASIVLFILALLAILNAYTGIFFSASVCPHGKVSCSPVESVGFAEKESKTSTGFTLETFDSLFLRQAESVLQETEKGENTKTFEGQFRPYLLSRQTTFTGTGSILPLAKDFLTKGTLSNLEWEYISLTMDNAIKTELKNFLIKNEASLLTTYERQYEKKLPLIFDPASSIRLFEQLQNTYSSSGQLFIVENMSRASEVQEGKQYDYVDWTATVRASLPYLTRFLEDLENAQSLKERSSIINLPFFILQKGKITYLQQLQTGSGQILTEPSSEVRADIVLRMYIAKVTQEELQKKRDEVQVQLDRAKGFRDAGVQVPSNNIIKYDQLTVLGNERVLLYREALRANNLRVAYNELTTLQEIYTELLTYFS